MRHCGAGHPPFWGVSFYLDELRYILYYGRCSHVPSPNCSYGKDTKKLWLLLSVPMRLPMGLRVASACVALCFSWQMRMRWVLRRALRPFA